MSELPAPPEPFSLPVIPCPACNHGIDPHGLEPGDYCGVGTLTEDDSGEGRLINVACKCLWSPNDIAAYLVMDERQVCINRRAQLSVSVVARLRGTGINERVIHDVLDLIGGNGG